MPRAMLALIAALAALACLGGPALAVEDGSFDEDIYTILGAAKPCVRLLTVDGNHGCATSSKGFDGAIYRVGSVAEAESFAAKPPSGEVAVLMPAPVFRASVVNQLRDGPASVAGVLVGYSGDVPDSAAQSPAEATAVNPGGDGQLLERYPFAIVYLTAAETAAVEALAVQNARWDADGDYVANHADFRYEMLAKSNSVDCLADNTCGPLGGHSVWATLGNATGDEQVMAVTAIDAAAMFQDAVQGVDAAVSGTAALLAAFEVLASSDLTAGLERRVVFAFFQGEAWDSLGSRRFFSDLESFNCTQPSDDGDECVEPPTYDLAFTSLPPLNKTAAVIEVQQVFLDPRSGRESGPKTLYTHTATDALAEAARTAAAPLNGSVTVAASAVASPPGPAASLARTETGQAVPRMVLSAWDAEYSNRFYHSRLDNRVVQDPRARDGADRIRAAANVLARTLFTSAGGSDADANRLEEASVATVTKALNVLTGVESVSGLSGLDNHYTSVFAYTRAEAMRGVPRYLADTLEGFKANATAAHFHFALEPYVSFDRSAGRFVVAEDKPASVPVWTESSWPDRFRTRVFRAEDPVVGWTMLGVGLFSSLAVYAATPALQRWASQRWKMV